MKLIRSWKKVFESDLSNLAIELKESLETPTVLFLEGSVGAGKTTLTRFFIDRKEAQSPSYSLINEYENYLHADLYRLEKKDDLIHLEIPMYTEEKDYFIIEWGYKYFFELERIIGDEFKYYKIDIEINDSNKERISRNYHLTKL